MNDKELMILAAKAAGIEVNGYDKTLGLQYVVGSDDSPFTDYWNPLDADGDALRLAVKLNMYVMRFDTMTTARSSAATCDERDDGDPYAATRRAIVRAAAEIGKSSSNA